MTTPTDDWPTESWWNAEDTPENRLMLEQERCKVLQSENDVLEKSVAEIGALHTKVVQHRTVGFTVCEHCRRRWPCPTVAILERHANG